MVRRNREEFETGRPPRWPSRRKPRGNPNAPAGWAIGARLLWLRVAFVIARVLLYLAQLLSNIAARLLQRRLLPLVFVRWMLKISYASTRLSFCVLRACVGRRASR